MTRHHFLSFSRRDLLIIFSILFCIFISSLVLAETEPFTASLKIQPAPKSPVSVKENITFTVVGESSGDPADANKEEYSTNLRWILDSATVSYSISQNGSSSSVPTHTFSVSPSVGSETTGGSWSCSFQSETAGYWSFSFSATVKIDVYKTVDEQDIFQRTETTSAGCSTTTILVSVNIVVQQLGEDNEENPGAFVGIEDWDTASLSYSPSDLKSGTLTLSATNLKVADTGYSGSWQSQLSWNLANNQTPPGTVWFIVGGEAGTGSLQWKHSCNVVDTVKVTIVKVEISKVEEKPWGMGWSNAEDSGSYQVDGKDRKWYFLWTTDEHKYTMEVKPTSANNVVSSVSLSSLGNATKEANGKWTVTKSTPAAGDYLDLKATAVFGNKSTQSKPIDVGIYTLTGVTWEQATNGASISGNKIYPEKPSATANAQKEVNVVASIDRLPSAGMKGTVHLKQLDPMNQCTASVGTPTAVGTGSNDNNGTLNNINGKTLEFTQGSGINAWVKGTFGNAHPGDNYIVAAHQRQSIAASISIDTANPSQVADIVANKKPAANSILEVWRTLWVERDQLGLPNSEKFAGLPEIGGIVSSEFIKICIEIKEHSPNLITIISGVDKLPKNWEGTPKGAKNYSYDYRNIIQPQNDFWSVQIVGAFYRRSSTDLGVFYEGKNTIFIFHSRISGSSVEREEVTLHELGHLFSLDDEISSPPQTVMNNGALLMYQHFSVEQIKIIQSQIKPL